MPTPPSPAILRARLAAAAAPAGRHGTLAFDDPLLAAHLPGGGLMLGALHEILADGMEAETGALAAAFAACLLARLLARDAAARPVIWIAGTTDLYPPGLAAYGLDPARLLLAQGSSDALILGAAEAALRDGTAAAVVAEAGGFPRLAGRRLMLAAQAGGSTGFVLRRRPPPLAQERLAQDGRRAVAGQDGVAAATRWRLAPAPSVPQGREPGAVCWQVTLLHARGGRPGAWLLRLDEGGDDAPQALRVVAALGGASGGARQRRRA